jgi:hypothetical protein
MPRPCVHANKGVGCAALYAEPSICLHVWTPEPFSLAGHCEHRGNPPLRGQQDWPVSCTLGRGVHAAVASPSTKDTTGDHKRQLRIPQSQKVDGSMTQGLIPSHSHHAAYY